MVGKIGSDPLKLIIQFFYVLATCLEKKRKEKRRHRCTYYQGKEENSIFTIVPILSCSWPPWFPANGINSSYSIHSDWGVIGWPASGKRRVKASFLPPFTIYTKQPPRWCWWGWQKAPRSNLLFVDYTKTGCLRTVSSDVSKGGRKGSEGKIFSAEERRTFRHTHSGA